MKSKIVKEILFESFYDNGSTQFVVKQDSKKDKRFRVLLDYSYYLAEKFGKVYLSEDKLSCALLIDPKRKKTTLGTILWDIKLLFGCIGLSNMNKVLKREKTIHSFHPTEYDYIHLWYIGVRKNHQGKGLGSKMLHQIINDYSDTPIFLETSNPKNFPFYESNGFERIAELDELGYPLKIYERK